MRAAARPMVAVLGATLLTLGSTMTSSAQQLPVRFMTLDPGHFHAALVHKQMYPQVDPRIDVYAPLGFDLLEHLGRVAAFNTRAERPTAWRAEVHTGPDFLERMLRERPGNVVVLAGRAPRKLEYIERSLAAGLHVLADKPWIVRAEELPRLEAALESAAARGVVALDMMTERHEVTNALQRELVNDPAVFGAQLPGTPEEPGVSMRSVHHILKTVAGAPLRRPVWFFDPREQGEALADVGTHLVDLSIWTLFPDRALDPGHDVGLVGARGWPTLLSRDQFARVTGERDFPASLAPWTRGDSLACACNNRVVYTLRGVHVRLDVLWDVESPHGDTHHAVYRGERASVEVRQGAEQGWRPEVYVVAATPARAPEVRAAVLRRLAALQRRWPGVTAEDQGDALHILIPDRFRTGHEAHFAEVTSKFLNYLADPGSLPAWERPNMLARYLITTRGTLLSQPDD